MLSIVTLNNECEINARAIMHKANESFGTLTF